MVNLTTKELAYATDYCGVKSGKDVDKFGKMRLTKLASEKINSVAIAESPVNIECKVRQIMELGSHSLFIADVVNVRVDSRYIDEKGRFNLAKSELIAYSHGRYYELGKELGTFGYSIKKSKETTKKVKKETKEKQSENKKIKKSGTVKSENKYGKSKNKINRRK